ncbi:unnamed protein product, partial [Rotaria sp. Silwood1]
SLKDGIVIGNNERIKMNFQGKYIFRISEANLEAQTNVQIKELPIYVFHSSIKRYFQQLWKNTRDYRLDCEINKENKTAQ